MQCLALNFPRLQPNKCATLWNVFGVEHRSVFCVIAKLSHRCGRVFLYCVNCA